MRAGLVMAGVFAIGFAGSGCAILRGPRLPATEPHPAPAEINEERLEKPPDARPARALFALAAARIAQLVGQPWEADLMLQAAAEAAGRQGDGGVQARALYWRAMLAAREGGEPGAREQAAELLRQAEEADPGGTLAAPAQMALALLDRLESRQAEIASLQERISQLEAAGRKDRAETARLQEELDSLESQLRELKQVHLRIESEKDDDPS